MAILITGGTGFLGAHLTRLLVIEKGRTDVVLFDHNPTIDRIADVADAVTVVNGDILEPHQLMHAMSAHDVDTVAHFAFMSGTNHPERTLPYVRLTCDGTANVFEAARLHGIRRVVNASSSAVWSPPFDEEKTEEHANPRILYGATKLWTEHLANTFNQQHAMEILSLRVTATMGRGRLDKGSRAAGLMGPDVIHFMAAPELAARGQAVTMPPDDQPTEFLYARDAAEAWWCAMTAPRPQHTVFSLTSERRTAGDLTRALRQLLPDAQIDVSTTPVFPGPLMSNSRLVQELGFEPHYTLEAGVAAYLEDVARA